MNQLLQVGVITTTHGLKGEVKVYPVTEDMHRFSDLVGKPVIIDPDRRHIETTLESARYFKDRAILKFKGFDDIDAVQTLCHKELWISREDAIDLRDGEFFIGDLIGLQVVREDDSVIGTVSDVLQTGANDVYVIQREGKKDLLVPAIRDCIDSVDLEHGIMKVHLLQGLEEM